MHKVMYPVIKDEHLLLNVYVYNSSVQYQYTCKHVVVLLADNLYNDATTPHVHVLLIVAMSWRVCVHLQYAVVTYVSLFISLALLSEHVIHLCPPQVWVTAVLSAHQHGPQGHIHLPRNTGKEWRETGDHWETKEKPKCRQKGEAWPGLRFPFLC